MEDMKGAFGDGMKIIDYGCGIGLYANFINDRISKFLYIGLEKKGGKNLHGESSMAIAKKIVRFRRNIKFGFIDSNLEIKSIN